MQDSGSFDELLLRLRSGDEAAAAEIHERFARQLIGLAQRKLDGRLRAKADPEDVVQSVYKSLCLRLQDGQFELADWNGLWGLLVRITLRKCGHHVQHFLAAKRDVRQEIPPARDDSSVAQWEPMAREPRPEEALLLAETLEQLLTDMSAVDREIICLRLQSHTFHEISEQTGRSEKTVERVLKRARDRLTDMQVD